MERSSYRYHRVSGSFIGRITLAAMTLAFAIFASFPAHLTAQASKVKRKVVISVQPDYPYILRNAHFEGQVKLEATVQPSGNVTKVDIKGGNPMLSQYAQQAVLRWKYAAGPAQTLEEVVFTFNSNSADTK
ncbi:MAG TPA: TonB family protein [Candidatus Sulfotelmatobacter sp.]|jgi:TonB family protein